MTKLRHYDHDGRVRFVRFSCHHRLPVLSDGFLRQPVADAIDRARADHGFGLPAYVIMPEHVHMVILRNPDSKVGRIVEQIELESAVSILNNLESRNPDLLVQLNVRRDKELRRAHWLRRCFDHNSRDHDLIQEKTDYCHFNPVKRGLVPDPSIWKFSSFNWYEGYRDVPLEMDETANPEGKPTLGVGH